MRGRLGHRRQAARGRRAPTRLRACAGEGTGGATAARFPPPVHGGRRLHEIKKGERKGNELGFGESAGAGF